MDDIPLKDLLFIDNWADICDWMREKKSKAYICRKLNCSPERFDSFLKRNEIEYIGNKSGKGINKKNKSYMPLKIYLIKSKGLNSNKIRKKLLRERYKKHKCECCGRKVWLGIPIPLELHHIDGNKNNNKISNFALLCPNCHALTDSYRGKNKKK